MRSNRELFSLEGRVAVLTGGAGHLALALATGLIEQGARVVLGDREAGAGAARAAELCRQAGREAATFRAVDLLDEAATRAFVAQAAATWGRLDILIHNAAYTGGTAAPGWAEPFERQTLDAWDEAMRVNLGSAFVLAQAAAPWLVASPGPSVLLVSSIYGLVGPQWDLYEGTGMVNPAAYGASKGGLLQLARYLATTLAPIRVNCLSPGGIRRGQPQAFQERYAARTPLKRLATEEDCKGAAVFLASDASAYLTGQNIVVDGGWTCW